MLGFHRPYFDFTSVRLYINVNTHHKLFSISVKLLGNIFTYLKHKVRLNIEMMSTPPV